MPLSSTYYKAIFPCAHLVCVPLKTTHASNTPCEKEPKVVTPVNADQGLPCMISNRKKCPDLCETKVLASGGNCGEDMLTECFVALVLGKIKL